MKAIKVLEPCKRCEGKGTEYFIHNYKIASADCRACQGKGEIVTTKHVVVAHEQSIEKANERLQKGD